MSGKRSSRSKIQKFYCPYCEERLWRQGGTKHYIFYAGIGEINRHSERSSGQPGILTVQNACIDHKRWLEKFFCRSHGKVWLLVSKRELNKLTTRLAVASDWQCSTGTLPKD
jgi:hypothetical protein